jgi:hypothetical protein
VSRFSIFIHEYISPLHSASFTLSLCLLPLPLVPILRCDMFYLPVLQFTLLWEKAHCNIIMYEIVNCRCEDTFVHSCSLLRAGLCDQNFQNLCMHVCIYVCMYYFIRSTLLIL